MSVVLSVQALKAAYGDSQVLFGVDFDLIEGELVGFLGRNGMGKTTTLSTIIGMLQPTSGSIVFRGHKTRYLPLHQIARLGMAIVPEGRRVFANLTVSENLVATSRSGNEDSDWTVARVMALFPRLAARRSSFGWQLSGGEQQMLAIGRALMTNPRLLLVDEATEGLAPQVRDEIWDCMRHLRADGMSLLIVDKDVAALSEVCDRHIVLEKGSVAWTGPSKTFGSSVALQQQYLGL